MADFAAAPRYGPVQTVAVLSDAHGNVPALAAVLAEPEVRAAELVVFCGDLTWGTEPRQTVELVRALGSRAVFVRGNGDRAVVEIATGVRPPAGARDEWMLAQHPSHAVEFLAGFHFNVVVDVAGLGVVRFCHGSPRGDTELVTAATSPGRYAQLCASVAERVIVHGHTHLQFDRIIAHRRSVNPGSVGLPYHVGPIGTAYWALLGPDVSLRNSRYDVTDAVSRIQVSGDPASERMEALLISPPSPAQIIEHAESLGFSD